MKHEFKVKKLQDETVYTLESATGGGTSAGAIASVSTPVGGVQRRASLVTSEEKKDAPKPRNFVAKNAKMGGAGQHKDKKKAEKQGDVKHKKPYMESLKGRIEELKSKLDEVSLGDYRKKATMQKAQSQMGAMFAKDPEEREKNVSTFQKRERGLNRLKARDEKSRADAQTKQSADLVARLPELKAEYEKMRAEYKSLGGSNWQYADREQNLTDYERKARSMEGPMNNLWRQIQAAEKAQGEQGVAEDAHGSEHFMDIIDATNGDVRGIMQELRSSGLHSEIIKFCQWAREQGIADIFDAIKLAKRVGLENDDENEFAYEGYLRAMELLGQQGVAEGTNDTIYPNAEVIKSKNGKPVGEIYQDGNSWGAFHYKADRGYDFIDSREEAIEALKDLHQETGRSRPDYTVKGVAEGLPQTLRKVVPGHAKREIDKKMDAGKFGKTDADKDANFQRYKKIQDKIKEQSVAEDAPFLAKAAGGLALGALGAAGAPAIVGLLGPILGTALAAYGAYNSAKGGMWAVDKLWDMAAKKLGGDNSAAEFAKAHMRAAAKGEGSFEFNGSTFKTELKPTEVPAAAKAVKQVSESKKRAVDLSASLNEFYETSVMEKIPANAPVDVWIQDFEKSTAPQFRGKNKAKRRQMAIAASYGAKNPKKKKK